MGVKDREGRPRAAPSAGLFCAGRRDDDGHDDGNGGGFRKRGKRGGVRRSFWQGVRDQAGCRETSAYAPAARRHRRRDEGTSEVPVVQMAADQVQHERGTDDGLTPTALETAHHQLVGQERVFVSPSLEVSQVQDSTTFAPVRQADQQSTDEELNDARSVATLLDQQLMQDSQGPSMLPPQDLTARALGNSQLVTDGWIGDLTGWGSGSGGLMPLFSPPRQQQL